VQNSVWDERELVRRCKEGSEAAYAELVRQQGVRLVTLAYRLTGSRETAEDVVQETFLAAFRAMERFEPKPALAPWLTTIAVRFASKAATRQPRPASLDALMGSDSPDGGPAFQAVSTAPDPHASAEAAEIRAEVQRALDMLPFKQRSAVVLRLVLGMDYAEAARAMDVPLNTYKSHLLRGTRQLRADLLPLVQRTGGEPAGPDLHTGGPDVGQPVDRTSNRAVPVIDDQFVAGSLSTRPERAISVAAASRRSTGSTPIADDSSL
jgi:RNA polymerase sigma-70 factor (ECF subfamily)